MQFGVKSLLDQLNGRCKVAMLNLNDNNGYDIYLSLIHVADTN